MQDQGSREAAAAALTGASHEMREAMRAIDEGMCALVMGLPYAQIRDAAERAAWSLGQARDKLINFAN